MEIRRRTVVDGIRRVASRALPWPGEKGLEWRGMRLWLTRRSEVSLREQLVTQVVLGILCGDLAAGERLPSTRELARRFRLHPNTVSASYRQLARERWVEFRRGSGVFVREGEREDCLSPTLALDRLIANFFRSARMLGVPLATVNARLRQCLELQPPDHFLLIEPDEELRRITAAEMQGAVTLPVEGCGLVGGAIGVPLEGAIPVALPSKEKTVRRALPAGIELIPLQVRSVPASLEGWLPAPPDVAVGVASRWAEFLKVARTMLLAAGFDADQLVFRDARKRNWRRGLEQTAAVVCDCVTAGDLPKSLRAVPYRLLSDGSVAELRRYEEFFCHPPRAVV